MKHARYAAAIWIYLIATGFAQSSTHPCDLPSASSYTVQADTIVTMGWCQDLKVQDASGQLVPAVYDGFTINWNGNLLDLKIGTMPAAEVAAPVGEPSASGKQEYRTTLFFGGGIHTLHIVAFTNTPTGRLTSGPSQTITVEATATNLPVDCVVSDWSEWSAWKPINATTIERSRTRTVVTQPANGGAGCPSLVETQTLPIPPEVCGDKVDNDFDGQIDEGCEPPPDQCVVTPLRVTGIKWPSGQTGNKSLTYNSGTFQIVSFTHSFNPQRVVFTDSRGCSVTVTR